MKKWFSVNKQVTIFLLKIFIFWQIAIVIIIGLGAKFIPGTINRTNSEYKEMLNPQFLWSRANFDGIHYLDIAKKGYSNFQQAFFPVYPQLIKFLTPYFFERNLLAGLTISWISFFVALFFLYKLVSLDFQEEVAKRTIFFLILFPGAFFFSAVYSESLFLALVLGSFYFARTKKWWLVGILGAVASGTRLVGIFLFPALLWEWWEQNNLKFQSASWRTNLKLLKTFLPILLVPLGLFLYMRFLAINYRDPLLFAHSYSAFGAGRTDYRIILLYQVFWRYLKMIVTTRIDPLYFAVWLEFLSASSFLILLIFAWFKKIRLSYLLFATFSYILPTTIGTFLSMQRLVLVLFPCFLVLALVENKVFRYFWWFLSFILLVISTLFFTRGYWIG